MQAALSTTKAVMTSPLPVVYEDTAASAGAAVPAHAPIGGSGFNADAVSRVGGGTRGSSLLPSLCTHHINIIKQSSPAALPSHTHSS